MNAAYPQYSDHWFLQKYFQYGSVESVLKYESSIPISNAGYHRLICSYGIITSAGRQVSFPEVLHFFYTHGKTPSSSLRALYKKMPNTFKTSSATIHRIYQAVNENITRRYATALALTTDEDHSRFLLGREVTSNPNLAKKAGMWTVPMTFSKPYESDLERVFRVLQQEVSVEDAIDGNFSIHSSLAYKLKQLKPLFTVKVLDIQLSVYYLHLPKRCLRNLTSYKLTNHQFYTIDEILKIKKESLRPGIHKVVSIACKNVATLTKDHYKIPLTAL